MKMFPLVSMSILIWSMALLSNGVFAKPVNQDRNSLPEIGVVASDALTLDKEVIIGDIVMRQMRGQAPIIGDPVLTEYLQDLGNRLVVEADNTKFPFEFFWINNDQINAFAFFGGHVGVHTGLIKASENESELASVLAHEVAHVTQRHIARRSQAQQRSSPLAIASLFGSILLALANPEAGMAAISTTQAMSAQAQIDYTRSNEQEADRIGIDMLGRAGFDTRGAATFFGKMAEQYRLVSRPPARLLTHPLSEDRIADARSRIGAYPQRNLAPSLPYNLAKARVMARYSFAPKYALEYFEAALKNNTFPLQEATLYGLAIALFENEKYAKANNIISELLAKDPENLFYLDLHTDIAIALGDTKGAIGELEAHHKRSPTNTVLTLNLANALLVDGQRSRVITLLRDYLLVHQEDQIAHQLLIEAYQQDKSYLDMHQTKAELFALYGAYTEAIDQLQHAYNFSGDDHLVKQRIRARIRQLREQKEKLERL